MDRRNGEEGREGGGEAERHGTKKKGKKLSLKFPVRLLDPSTDIPKILQLNCILRERRVDPMFASFSFSIAVSSSFSCLSSLAEKKGSRERQNSPGRGCPMKLLRVKPIVRP